MLSALTGGGLTAVGLGGPLSGGALAADPPSGSGTPAEPPPSQAAAGTTGVETPAPGAEPRATNALPSSPSTTTSTPTPPGTSTTPPPATTPPASGAGGAPTVVVQRTQKRSRAQRPARNVTKTKPASGGPAAGGSAPGGAPSAPATPPPGTPNNVAVPPLTAAGEAGTLSAALGQTAVSTQALDFYRIPLFLLPIYQAAGVQYGVPWQILAAINEVETDYGSDLSVSTAGAVGWMQFMPATWLQYGVDALAAGYADPYNPVDAIFAAARYLHAAGASSDLHRAILAYNHSEAYVDSVLLRAKLIAGYPQSTIATLTGLVQGRMPLAGARIAPDTASIAADVLAPSSSSATAGAVALAPPSALSGSGPSAAQGGSDPSAAALSGSGSTPDGSGSVPGGSGSAPAPSESGSPAAQPPPGRAARSEQFADLLARAGAPVVAVQDGRVVKLGRSRKLGNYLALRDIYGDVFTYAGLGSIAPSYRVRPHRRTPHPARALSSTLGTAAAAAGSGPPAAAALHGAVPAPHDPAPRLPASAGHQPPLTLHVKAPPRSAGETEALPASDAGSVPAGMGKVRLYAHPGNPVAHEAAVRTGALSPQGAAGDWRALRLGSVVSQGTILGHLAGTPEAGTARLRFAIRPAGDPSTVDPRPILANWRELNAALHPKGAKATPNLLGATAAEVFLMSKGELERTVLADPGIDVYQCGRQDIASGAIDSRVLAVLAFLSRSGLRPTVSALRCGHSEYTTSGNVSEHYYGDAVDISAVNGIPILGHQGAGSITDVTIRTLLTLQGQFVPHQIISLMQYPGAPNTLALPDHYNHIHVGFHPRGVTLTPGLEATDAAAHSAGPGRTAPSPQGAAGAAGATGAGELSPAQWEQLVARIAALPSPTVAAKPSAAAIRDPQAAQSNRDLGANALPFGGEEE
jgi:hypothetical protein